MSIVKKHFKKTLHFYYKNASWKREEGWAINKNPFNFLCVRVYKRVQLG